MIPASDLRIGNLYKGASRGNIETATGHTIAQIEEGKLNALPLELTPEILESAGFSNEGMSVGSEWWNKLVGIRTSYNGVCCYEISLFKTQHEDFGINLEEQYFGYCKYLHELQNKYYAITGEEIKIELPTTGKE